ncbi:putative acyltransferase [Pandoraea terrae]|uniref:Putative acyltransferase n=1 Tax=Pandoraea terrae TaxID=1537710 RepID=A0A5E4US43_9BURK|nr:acyltransferase [Pandoraea terrae]VVE02384.1 putative acyltransferase [Pandoraea terrae]
MLIRKLLRVDTGGRRIELDFVRGLAILAVMGAHFRVPDTGDGLLAALAFPLKSFGHEGVNLFFALSGFLVGGLLLRQYAAGRVEAGRFIVRRIFKIWPAYYALLLFHWIAGRHPTDGFLMQNALHVQNYLGSSITQTWSLAIEEHFYLLLPVLLLIFVRRKLGSNAVIASLGAICVAVLLARAAAVGRGDLQAAFAHTQYRIDSLLFGTLVAACYWLKPQRYAALARRRGVLVMTVLCLLAWLLTLGRDPVIDRSIGYSVQAVGYCALIVLTLEHSGSWRTTRGYRWVAWLGQYSYGIYLWHSLALMPGTRYIAWTNSLGMPVEWVWWSVLLLQLSIAVSVGYAMTRLIELPFLYWRDRVVPAGAAATAPPADARRTV